MIFTVTALALLNYPLCLCTDFLFTYLKLCLFSKSKFSLKVASPSEYWLSCIYSVSEFSSYFLTSVPSNFSILFIFQNHIF